MARKPTPTDLAYYEGLVCKTAAMYTPYIEDEFDDVVQTLRIKCLLALRSYDPKRSSMPVEKYVFMCMRNGVKDMLKRKRRDLAFIEDGAADFEGRYLTSEDSFDEIEAERPLIPSTLSLLEREVLALLYAGYKPHEIQRRLRVPRAKVDTAVNELQAKFGDWRPSTPVALDSLAA